MFFLVLSYYASIVIRYISSASAVRLGASVQRSKLMKIFASRELLDWLKISCPIFFRFPALLADAGIRLAHSLLEPLLMHFFGFS